MKETIEDLKELPIRPMFPNMVTMMALAVGVSSLQFAFWGNWSLAVICIGLAAFLDALDGRVARMLNTSSRFGAELDSLADVINFGVAPGFLLYLWTMDGQIRIDALAAGVKDPLAIGVPWMAVLFLALCCALRLARFNTMLDKKEPPKYWTHFFVGLPAPGGAYVALLPLVFYLWTGNECFAAPNFVAAFMVSSGCLMASRVPTPCFKKLHFNGASQLGVLLTLAFLAAFVALLFKHFWAVIGVMGLIYVLIMIPAGIVYFIYQKRLYKKEK